MSLKEIFKKILNGKKTDEKSIADDENWNFVTALVAILLGAVLVNLWIRVINNFTYHTLGLDQDSTFWAIIVAVFFTIILIVYIIFVLEDNTGKAVKQSMTGISVSGIVPAINGQLLDITTDI
jgi:hypothetical protein